MKKSTQVGIFASPVEKVWDLVTNKENIAWRTDVTKVEIIEKDKEFKETTAYGIVTYFKVVESIPFQSYTLDMKNDKIQGVFKADFESLDNGGCKVTFFQENQQESLIASILSSFFLNLNKLQLRYIYDIKKALGEI